MCFLKQLRRAGVDYVDLLGGFVARAPEGRLPPDYYWVQDAHFTHKGYEILARALSAELTIRLWFREQRSADRQLEP